MTRKAYPSDVTNAEWQIIERLLPIAQTIGRPRQVDLREIINGIFYVLREGCSSRVPYRMTYHLGKLSTTTFGIGSV
jgi:transposase